MLSRAVEGAGLWHVCAPKHLPAVMAMFSGVVMLNVDQEVTILQCARGPWRAFASLQRFPALRLPGSDPEPDLYHGHLEIN